MKAEYEQLCSELDALLDEASAAQEPIVFPPTKARVQATLDRMSQLAHLQTQHAHRLGTSSAMKLAAKTHARVAHAAGLHGLTSMAKEHAKVSKALHLGDVEKLAKMSKKADKKKKIAGQTRPGKPLEAPGQKAKPPVIPAAAQRPVIGTRGH